MRAPSFAHLLEEALRRTPAEPPAPRAWSASPLPHPATFLFSRPLTSAVPRWPQPPVARPLRVRHALTPAQQAAVDRFAALGVSLAADFGADELRRAYRRLAQRYHPDRHAGADPGQRETLVRGFADAAAAYRCLRPLVDPRH